MPKAKNTNLAQSKFNYKRCAKQDSFQKTSLNFTGNIDAYDSEWNIFGYDGYDSTDLKNEIRYRLFHGTTIGDKLEFKSIDEEIRPIQNQQYTPLEITYIDKKSGKELRPFPNAQDTPDLNGVRGRTPLNNRGNNKNAIQKKLKKLSDCGIESIIDLRSANTCNKEIKKIVRDTGINYFNFPIEELSGKKCTDNFLDKITGLFEIINKGDFFIGCANGESRTDLTLGINYTCNAEAKKIPTLKWLYTSNPDMNLRTNLKQIHKLVAKNPQIVLQWGWESYEEFKHESSLRLQKIYDANKKR